MKNFHYTRYLVAMIICFLIASFAFAQQKKATVYYPPAGSWEHLSPVSLGMDSTHLQQAVQYAKDNESKESRDLKKAHYLGAFGREPFGYAAGPLKERGPATGLIIKN